MMTIVVAKKMPYCFFKLIISFIYFCLIVCSNLGPQHELSFEVLYLLCRGLTQLFYFSPVEHLFV